MTREEIKQAAEAYASQMCKDCPARILFCEEKNKKCVERREQEEVFADGVKWADKHPANVWHSADEEPTGDEWTVLCQDKYGSCFLVEYRPYSDSDETWDEYVNSLFISKWAYIHDLLPKGGEL